MKKKRGNKSLLPPPPVTLPPPPIDDLKAEEAAVQPTAHPDSALRLTMAPQAVEAFLYSLKDYYNTDTFSDAVIACDGQEFKVHGMILSAHSKYFAKELNGNWKVVQESSEKKIDVKDFDASVVEAMLRFMYSFDYSNIYSTSTMVYDAQVYQIADKYDIPTLKAHAKSKFGIAIATGWNMDDFPLAISVVYESTPSTDRGLRDLVVETSRRNIDKLLGHDGFCELIRKTPDFAADLIPSLCGKLSTKRYGCPSCDHQFRGDFSGKHYHCPSCSQQRSDWDSYQI